MPLSAGKIRGLSAASTPGGIFTILAIDHRDSMRAVLRPDDPEGIPAAELTDVKLWLLRQVGEDATAVMLDPEYSAAQAIAQRALPGSVGFLAALEAQGYLGDATARQTTLLDGWTVDKAKRLGASGIKLLVLYRPDTTAADAQDRVIASVIADCARFDIPLFLEPLSYAIGPETRADAADFASQRRRIVIDTVRRLGALGPDVLKVQFPVDTRHETDRGVWADACAELDEASPVPWALLSGGDPFELFVEQVETACRAGASGFMVGRALWREAVVAAGDERSSIIETVVRPRFRQLAETASTYGRSWTEGCDFPTPDENWYLTY